MRKSVGMLFNLRDYKKCFLLSKNIFKNCSHFPTFKKSLGMLFNVWGLQEMFSFIQKLYSKIFSHFPILAIFGEFGVIFCNFCKK